MNSATLPQLTNFLEQDLAIPPESVDLAVRRCEQSLNLLPIVLWQYGLVSLEQLDRIFDWLETI